MSAITSIEWTEGGGTWNPTRGCKKCSPGCTNCYACVFAERFRGVPGHAYERGFDPRIVPEKLCEPVRWTTPIKIFVNSMSDLFYDGFSDEYIVDCAKVMEFANWHTFQVLTKRADRMAELLKTKLRFVAEQPHIWWGTSVENRKHGVPRIMQLTSAPAGVRFLSIEPLIEYLGTIDLNGISWVIVGGESGPGARPIMNSWVTDIRDQCKKAGVPFFFKQWGGIQKSKTGRMLDREVHNGYPAGLNNPIKSTEKRTAFIQEMECKYLLH
jgi:protein gp37